MTDSNPTHDNPRNTRNLPAVVTPGDAARPADNWLVRAIRTLFGWKPGSVRDDLQVVLDASAPDEAGFSAVERTMLRNILGLHERRIADVMVHRADIIADVFGGAKPIRASIERFKADGRGVLVYLRAGVSGVPTRPVGQGTASEIERSKQWREVGLGARMDRDGHPHDGSAIAWEGRPRFFIDTFKYTGKRLMSYGQTVLTEDLYAARDATGGQIVVRTASARESILSIDGRKRELVPSMLVIADAQHPVALAGVTILIVEQNVHGALAVSDTAIVMELGRKFLEGPATQVRDDPRIREAYLGGNIKEKQSA